MSDAGRPVCPLCGAVLVPVVYGYPSWPTVEASERDELVLGGCTVEDGQPLWACAACIRAGRVESSPF